MKEVIRLDQSSSSDSPSCLFSPTGSHVVSKEFQSESLSVTIHTLENHSPSACTSSCWKVPVSRGLDTVLWTPACDLVVFDKKGNFSSFGVTGVQRWSTSLAAISPSSPFALSPDGHVLAVSRKRSDTSLCRMEDNGPVAYSLLPGCSDAWSFAFSGDGTRFVSRDSQAIKVWDILAADAAESSHIAVRDPDPRPGGVKWTFVKPFIVAWAPMHEEGSYSLDVLETDTGKCILSYVSYVGDAIRGVTLSAYSVDRPRTIVVEYPTGKLHLQTPFALGCSLLPRWLISPPRGE